jgi:hypothetical protein
MVDPLLGRGILCFEGGVRGNSGVSSVPMISSGSRSRLKENKEEVKHEITQESKKQVKRKLTLEWYVSLGRCPPWVACLCP